MASNDITALLGTDWTESMRERDVFEHFLDTDRFAYHEQYPPTLYGVLDYIPCQTCKTHPPHYLIAFDASVAPFLPGTQAQLSVSAVPKAELYRTLPSDQQNKVIGLLNLVKLGFFQGHDHVLGTGAPPVVCHRRSNPTTWRMRDKRYLLHRILTEANRRVRVKRLIKTAATSSEEGLRHGSAVSSLLNSLLEFLPCCSEVAEPLFYHLGTLINNSETVVETQEYSETQEYPLSSSESLCTGIKEVLSFGAPRPREQCGPSSRDLGFSFGVQQLAGHRSCNSRNIWMSEQAFLVLSPKEAAGKTVRLLEQYGQVTVDMPGPGLGRSAENHRLCRHISLPKAVSYALKGNRRTNARGDMGHMAVERCLWTHDRYCSRDLAACRWQMGMQGTVFGCPWCPTDFSISAKDHPRLGARVFVVTIWRDFCHVEESPPHLSVSAAPRPLVPREKCRSMATHVCSSFCKFYDAHNWVPLKLRYQPDWAIIDRLWK